MTKTIIKILFVLTFVSCDRQSSDNNETLTKKDTLNNPTILQADKTTGEFNLEKTLAVLNEEKQDKANKPETRFYFFQPPLRGLYEFYKINFSDSILLFKQFTQIRPDGSGKDSVYLIKITKLTRQNLQTIAALQDKSMFWNLKTLIESDRYPFDSDTYIYESIRIEKNKNDSHQHHHLVYSYAPTNKDFINFGQYIRLIAGQKNTYKE
ncbi:MAG: hypothetical protein JNM51_16400 [Bacteroidia bacterium]|nr:hypothetical protein [Bacteroidia bacterium]